MSLLSELHFIRPLWLLAIPLAALLPWAWRHLRRPAGDWARVCDAHLLRWLSVGEPGSRPGLLGPIVSGLALAMAALALSGPSWQRLPDAAYTARDARVLVLDLSLSMLAQDLRPDRLTRVRYRLLDVLDQTVEGQVGLVAYAGDAYVVSPLTSDTNTIANMLPALQPDIIPVAGSRADRGMELAAELLSRSGAAAGEVLLITDEADAADADLAARLAEQGIVVSVLAVGTREGAPIPSGNGFVSDADGNVVIARLDIASLQAVADAGRGRLSVLDTAGGTELPWKARDGSEFNLSDEGMGERWRDMGPWLVLALLPLAALAFRRGLLFALLLTVAPGLLVSPSAQAGWWNDLWQRRDQQAQAALEAERPGAAAALAKDPAIAGEAWYRSGEFARAADAWRVANDADAHFNRGNALAKAGELDAAIAAYDQALTANPEMEDALFNRALVEQLKNQQQQEQEGEGDSQQGESESGEDQQQGESQEQQGEQDSEGEPQESDAESEEGESGQQQAAPEAWTEEDAQAMEQWLRRIPDDPGGLLRRKFRNEHQRRGAPQDETKKW